MDKPIHILVVEDDNDINQLLCNMIRRSGYVPQPAFSGTEAILYLEKSEWDMVLLDLMLPGLSGEEILLKIRELHTVPILVISAKGQQDSKVNALRTGADDYITKPFDIEEVSARIDSHLRRYRRVTDSTRLNQLKYKDIVLDLDMKRVTVNDTELILTVKEYAIMELFLSFPKKVFTKANLFESVWADDFMGDDNTINVHMSNLRSKLSKANADEEYIETIWGMGYRLK
jgi:two-component system, OmpR family, response regulator